MTLTKISKAVYDYLSQQQYTVTKDSDTCMSIEIEEEDNYIHIQFMANEETDEVLFRCYQCLGPLNTDLELHYGKSACVHLNPYLSIGKLTVVAMDEDCTALFVDAAAYCYSEEEVVACIPYLIEAIMVARGMVYPFMAQNLRAATGGCTGPKLYHVK